MSSVFGNRLKVTIFGESHGAAVGCVLDGIPAGTALDSEHIALRLSQRQRGAWFLKPYNMRSGDNNSQFAFDFDNLQRVSAQDEALKSGCAPDAANLSEGCELDRERHEYEGLDELFKELVTSRGEGTSYEILSGASADGVCYGSPFCAVFRNTDVRRGDYDRINTHFRPGHADYVAFKKFCGFSDLSGGGHFSGRLTAPLVLAGAVAEQLLAKTGVGISARVASVGGIELSCDDSGNLLETAELRGLVSEIAASGDSVGSVLELRITGMPVGVGEPLFETLEGEIARMVFAVPAVKGIEFGRGFEFARLRGSETVDAFYCDADGAIKTRSNNNGGINGGISNGMDIEFRVAVKPASSIGIAVDTLDFADFKQRQLITGGRHDKCIGVRAGAPIVAATALAIYNCKKM